MGGQEGSRGYLVQTAIALLESLSDANWLSVTLEPNHTSEKVDVEWIQKEGRKAIQVKSSANQIGKADAEAWAENLKQSKSADSYELVLVGPCAESVVRMGSFDGVLIPCPKSLDIAGLLNQAAHLLDKFLLNEGLGQKSAFHRELMVAAMVTQLSLLSTQGQTLSRVELTALLKRWIAASESSNTGWQQIIFETQRGLDHAVSGQRLGPSDVEACPVFSISRDLINELDRSHLYELVGVAGCGKSITAWQVAKNFYDRGFSVWRPQAFKSPSDLLATFPGAERQMIVIDDAQRFGKEFATHVTERASAKSKLLLVSTVSDPLQAAIFCVHPERCVDELMTAMLARKRELMPIAQKFDDRIGDRVGDIDLESRIRAAGREKTPWEFFWYLRGGWQTATREFETIRQFPSANIVLVILAIGQVLSCDAGVTREWLLFQTQTIGLSQLEVQKAVDRLTALGLLLERDELRTKHLQYAFRLLDEAFSKENPKDWDPIFSIYQSAICDYRWPLKGVSWLLDGIQHLEAFRFEGRRRDSSITHVLIKRCTTEVDDIDWAAGCLSRLFTSFDVPVEEVLTHRELLLRWTVHGSGLVALFCSQIVNELINKSSYPERPDCADIAKRFCDDVDIEALIAIANHVSVADLYSFGSLLNRLAFYEPRWCKEFIEKLDWERLKSIILNASADEAHAVDKIVYCLYKISESVALHSGLRYVEEVVPYFVMAVNASPARALNAMHDTFNYCLGYTPRLFRGNDSPGDRKRSIARSIVGQFDPKAFAEAMSAGRPRDLERLARSFEMIWEIEPEFAGKMMAHFSDSTFFTSTSEEWRLQSRELQHILVYFALGEEMQPARAWIHANQSMIKGPLVIRLAAMAPEVAVAFHKSGRGVALVDVKTQRWNETCLAIAGIMGTDRELCIDLLEQQMSQFEDALYHLNLRPLNWIVTFFRLLHEEAPLVWSMFIDRLDLDKPKAMQTIAQLIKSQPKQRRAYTTLARAGRLISGKLGQLSKQLFDRLQNH